MKFSSQLILFRAVWIFWLGPSTQADHCSYLVPKWGHGTFSLQCLYNSSPGISILVDSALGMKMNLNLLERWFTIRSPCATSEAGSTLLQSLGSVSLVIRMPAVPSHKLSQQSSSNWEIENRIWGFKPH